MAISLGVPHGNEVLEPAAPFVLRAMTGLAAAALLALIPVRALRGAEAAM